MAWRLDQLDSAARRADSAAAPWGRSDHCPRPRTTSTRHTERCVRVFLRLGVLKLAGGDLGNHDGRADHVGGALLTSGPRGIIPSPL
jgi:hypothetical protein